MEEVKRSNNKMLIAIIVILTITVICLGGFIVYDKTLNNVNTNKENNQTTDNIQSNTQTEQQIENKGEVKPNTKQETTNVLSKLDLSKSINGNGGQYTLSSYGNAGIFASVDKSQKKLTFSFIPKTVVEEYSLDWKSNKTDLSSSTINFNKKIVNIFFGGMGHDQSGDTLFILLEDGTVEFIPIVHMFNNVQAEVVSYGKIKDVSDVVGFVSADVSYQIGGNITVLAVRSDGSFYDLDYSLQYTGFY